MYFNVCGGEDVFNVYDVLHVVYIFPGLLEVQESGESSNVVEFLNMGSSVCSGVSVLVSVASCVTTGLGYFPFIGTGVCWV